MKTAHVYLLKNRIIVHPNRKTTAGIHLATEPYSWLPIDCGDEELGQAVFSALKNSEGTIEHPKLFASVTKVRLSAAGVNSEKSFVAGARLVEVEETHTGFRLTPTFNGGATGEIKGFSPLQNLLIQLDPEAQPATIGQKILEAFKLCSAT